MAGTIAADTLTHSTAGSLTTDYVVNGSAKMWINFNGTGTPAARGSLNHSSITDEGTGYYTLTATNAMSDTNYAPFGGGTQVTDSGDNNRFSSTWVHSSSSVRLVFDAYSIGNLDSAYLTAMAHGDLA